MSGDMQARKRKEKKRKKDEEENVTPLPTSANVSENLEDNISIHIYKESNTGGHWCARIIFFAVLAVLVGFIGIVIIEHRGTTDINTPLESSRWAFIFDGWVDDSLSLTHEETHDNEHEEVTQIEGSEEKHDENIEENISGRETSEEKGQEEYEAISVHEEEDEAVEHESNEEESQIFASKEELSYGQEDEDSKQDEENNSQEFDDADVLEEIYNISENKNSEEETVTYETESQFDEMAEVPEDEDIFENFVDIPGINEINDDNTEPLEEIENVTPEEYDHSDDDENSGIEEVEEESANVAMKFGVGVALVVAAHFVLVRQWNDVELEKTQQPGETECKVTNREEVEMLKEINKLNKSNKDEVCHRQEEKQEDEEEEEDDMEEEEEEELEAEEEDAKGDERHGPSKRYQRISKERGILIKDAVEIGWKNTSDEEEEDEEEEDEEEEDEEGEEDEVESEEETEIFDDSELVAKLEAKYGKLQSAQHDEDIEHETEVRRKK